MTRPPTAIPITRRKRAAIAIPAIRPALICALATKTPPERVLAYAISSSTRVSNGTNSQFEAALARIIVISSDETSGSTGMAMTAVSSLLLSVFGKVGGEIRMTEDTVSPDGFLMGSMASAVLTFGNCSILNSLAPCSTPWVNSSE